MPNNLATLRGKLATALRDTTNVVWASAELDDLITWAVADLYPQFARGLVPSATTVTLVSGTLTYNLPAGVLEVSGVDWIDTGSTYLGPLGPQSWWIEGDAENSTGVLRVAPVYPTTGGTLRLHGYGRFDTATNLIPDRAIRAVLASARAEAYRRLAGDRVKFEQWLARRQQQNVTVNELTIMVNEADGEYLRAMSRLRTFRRSRPGRTSA